MGKASRSRGARAEINEIKKQQAAAVKKAQKKRALLISAVAIVIVLALVAGIVALIINRNAEQNGTYMRKAIAAETQDIKLTAAGFTYFLNYNYQNFVNNNANYLSNYGLDISVDLREQTMNDGTLWFDYFKTQTENNIKDLLVLAQAAKSENDKLTGDENKQIEDFIKNLQEGADEQKMTLNDYISGIYGKGVTETDVRAALEISQFATRKTSELEATTYSDKEIEDFFNENKNNYLKCDYRMYTFSPSVDENASDEQAKAAKEKAKADADKLAACKSVVEFDAFLANYLRDNGTSQADIPGIVENDKLVGSTYDETFEVSKWAFDEGAKVGDTYIYESGESYVVYMLAKAPYRDESATASVRHILIMSDESNDAEKKKKAEDILAEYNAGEKTAEAFGALAAKYTEDTGSASTGGLYENFPKGQMVAEFENWAFDESRTPGETGIVKTDYGYHIMYFVNLNKEAWKLTVKNDMLDKAYLAMCNEYSEKYPVTINEKAYDLVTTVKFASNSTASAQ